MNQYKEASKLLEPLLSKNGPGIKALAFGSKGKKPPSKAVYATVCHTLRSKSVLDSVISLCPTASSDFSTLRDPSLMYVLLYELLLGPYKSIRGGGGVKRIIVKHEGDLRGALKQLAETGSSSARDVITTGGGLTALEGESTPTVKTSMWPKYVRVNTLKTDLRSAVVNAKEKFGPSNVALHPVISNVFVLPSTVSDLYSWDMVERGEVIIQDLSSCLTAAALGGGNGRRWWDGKDEGGGKKKGKKGKKDEGVVMLDACAAPGNKTTHLAAIVNEGLEGRVNKVIALDRASERIKILKKRVALLGGDKGVVEPRHQDFLKFESGDKDLKNLKAILLDPSCSGSGIVNSPDRVDNEDSKERLRSLSSFQLLALVHAMSFPQVDYIAYSTCSINVEEDEAVVSKALKEGNEKLEGGEMWRLVAPESLKGWKRRGMEVEGLTKEQAACLCRSDPFDGDETNGFFVSYFERVKVGSEGGGEGIGGGAVGEGVEEYDVGAGEKVHVYKDGMFRDVWQEKKKKKGKKKGTGAPVVQEAKREKQKKNLVDTKDSGNKKRKAAHSIVPADTSNIPKKKLKKMMYKQRQREEKAARMKKQKEKKAS